MTHTVDASLDAVPSAGPRGPLLPRAVPPAGRFVLYWMLAWAATGFSVAVGFVFATDVDFWPALRLSVSFAEVVGFTAITSARMVFPLFVRLPFVLRLLLELLTTLSGTVFGSIVVIWLQPLFSLAQFRSVALIVLINAVIAAVVGIALATYDRMKRQIEASYEALREKERLESELVIARDVQRQLLPRSTPSMDGLDLAAACLPAVGVGGDYYDLLPLAQTQLGLVIADVSGKGIPAALLMASLQASVRSLCRATSDPGALNAQLNENLFLSSSSARYATLFFGLYDASTGMLCYSNAGHHPALLLRGDSVVRLADGGLPIGMFESSRYKEGRHRLVTGDLLALYTDGVVEAPGPDEEEFGEARLITLLRRFRERSANGIVEGVIDELHRWSAGTEAHDDVTLVLARIR